MNRYQTLSLIIKKITINSNIKFPSIQRILTIGIRTFYFIKFKIDNIYLNFINKPKYGELDFNKICWVNPQKIQFYISNKTYYKWKNSIRVLNGDWDSNKLNFENYIVYKSIRQRIKEKKEWKSTELFNLLPHKITNGKTRWTFKNEKERNKYFKKVELLAHKIKIHGYKTQSELYTKKELILKSQLSPILDEVLLAIDRNGHFLFVNGKHRLILAKIFNIPRIPVIFLIRHKKWMDFRKKLIDYSKRLPYKKLCQNPIHPDLQDIHFIYGKRTFNLIYQNILISKGKILDIEANLGYFCHRFEDKGFDCIAVESNPINIYFLKKLKKAENRKFKIISESLSDYGKHDNLSFDILLALNIFHQFKPNEDIYLELIKFLKRIKLKELFLGIDTYTSFQSKTYPYKEEYLKLLELIVENSSLNEFSYLGELEDGKKLYKFTSEK